MPKSVLDNPVSDDSRFNNPLSQGSAFSPRPDQMRSLFQACVESAHDVVYAVDLQGVLIYINTYGQQLLGYSEEQMIGLSCLDFVSPIWRDKTRQAWQWLMQQGKLQDFELVLRSFSGTEVFLEVNSSLVYEQGQAIGCINIGRDISERRQIEMELMVNNRVLEQSNQCQSEFLATMSHELRTPLTSIIGFSSILQKQIFGELNSKQAMYIDRIRYGGQYLLELINDVLDLSKVEAGQMTLEITPIGVKELCDTTLALISEQAQLRRLSVQLTVEANLAPLFADELRVQQMLLNLLSNAIKFSEPGGHIGVEVQRQLGQWLVIQVWDEGIGIAEDQLGQLFQPFQQVDRSAARRFQGTGLGLALTRKLAELHGGRVAVTSKLGEGSQFSIYLPFRRPEALARLHRPA